MQRLSAACGQGPMRAGLLYWLRWLIGVPPWFS